MPASVVTVLRRRAAAASERARERAEGEEGEGKGEQLTIKREPVVRDGREGCRRRADARPAALGAGEEGEDDYIGSGLPGPIPPTGRKRNSRRSSLSASIYVGMLQTTAR